MRLQTFCLALTLCLIPTLVPVGAATVTVGDPVTSCTPDCDYTTVAAAVSAASDGDTIVVQPDTYDEGDILLDKDLTIKSAGGTVTIDGGDTDDHVFEIAEGTIVTLQSLTLDNPGDSGNTATANLINRGTARLITVYVYGSAGVETSYGGIYNTAGALLLLESNGVISGNNSPRGGGITNKGALVAYNQTFSGNSGDLGGAIKNNRGLVAILNSSLSNNTAADKGGAYANNNVNEGFVAIFPSSSFSNNTATVDCDEEYSLYPSYLCVD